MQEDGYDDERLALDEDSKGEDEDEDEDEEEEEDDDDDMDEEDDKQRQEREVFEADQQEEGAKVEKVRTLRDREQSPMGSGLFSIDEAVLAYNQGYKVAQDRLNQFRVMNGVAIKFDEVVDENQYREGNTGEEYYNIIAKAMGNEQYINSARKVCLFFFFFFFFGYYFSFFYVVIIERRLIM